MVGKGTLIEAHELQAAIQAGPDCFVFDCRFSLADEHYGAVAFTEDHIPSAQFADLNKQLSATIVPGKTGRHPLPTLDVFLRQVQSWGVTPDAQVVAYDDGNGAIAARLWWMFRWLGHESVAVLNGGIDAWRNAGFETTTETQAPEPSIFQSRLALTTSINANEMLSQPGVLTDARDLPRFNGEVDPIDPVAGHIPGATCMPFSNNLLDGLFKSRDELRQMFQGAGISKDTPVTCYCGSGVTAAHNLLALVHAGYREPNLYAGSWSEWITDPERPVESGEQRLEHGQ